MGHIRRDEGMTLVEILTVIVIIGVLAALVFSVSNLLPQRAENAKCLANMRSLQVCLASYIQDVGHWPQEPESIRDNVNATEDWWLNALASYGATPETWQCPTIKRMISRKSTDGRPKIHYTPTMFDDNPLTPYKWSTQPWLIEIGNMHGNGGNICFPDGSIRTMNDVAGPG